MKEIIQEYSEHFMSFEEKVLLRLDKIIELLDKPKRKKKKNVDPSIVSAVVKYLNDKTDKNFKDCSKKTSDLIASRVNEGYHYEDFVMVIDSRCDKWLHDEKMSEFLRPETLFGSKFESYRNDSRKELNGCSKCGFTGWLSVPGGNVPCSCDLGKTRRQ